MRDWQPCPAPWEFGHMSAPAISQLNAMGIIPRVKRGHSRQGIYQFRQEGCNIFCTAKDSHFIVKDFNGLPAQVLRGGLRGDTTWIEYQNTLFEATTSNYWYGLGLGTYAKSFHLCPHCHAPSSREDRLKSAERATIPLRWPILRAKAKD